MSRANKRKKKAATISSKSEKRIVALSLKNPDFGARRLFLLLKKTDIDISQSKIYTILKRNGLKTRELRMAKIEEQKAESRSSPRRKKSSFITEAEEAQIVETALEHPDFGARRLAGLLSEEGIIISGSGIYTILKRHGLQNRALRLSKIEERRVAEASAKALEIIPLSEKDIVSPEKLPEPFIKDVRKGAAPVPSKTVSKLSAKAPYRINWLFHILNLMLIALIGYLGFYAAQSLQKIHPVSDTDSTFKPAEVRFDSNAEFPVQPLQEYRAIWERDLFSIIKKDNFSPQKSFSPENVPVAQKDLDLTLVGTVVGSNRGMNFAIIYNKKSRSQEIYREGNQAGEALVKMILRNCIIVKTPRGDERLAMDPTESSTSNVSQKLTPPGNTAIPSAKDIQKSSITFSIDSENVAPLLADIEGLLETIRVTQYIDGGETGGFQINGIAPTNVLARLGLRNGDVIRAINGESIRGPDQAENFFQKLLQGGEISIEVFRRRRYQELRLKVE